MRSYSFITAVFYFVGMALEIQAADPIEWLPAEVNAVARVNVAEIYQSSIAKKEGWIKRAAESFIQQESLIPPGTKLVVIGAELDLSDNLIARRKYSVLVPEKDLTLEKLSAWLPAGIETFAGKKMTQFGSDGYIVDAEDGCWLTASSSSRQLISRWLRNGRTSNGTQLSSYLQSTLRTADKSNQVILAIDLQDNFSASEIFEYLRTTDWFKTEVGSKSAAEVIESLKGITITFNVDAERSGTATMDFGRDTAPLKPGLEQLVNEVVDRVGVPSEALKDWKWAVKGNQIVGSGSLTPGSGREILSILDPPSITHAISSGSSASTEKTPANPMAKNSFKYCSSLRVLLDDLRATLHKEKDNHAVLQERYSRKIDNLPKLNVDGALLDFGARVSSSLRYQAQAERMNKIRAGTQKRYSYSAASMGNNFGNVSPYNNYYGGSALGAGDAPGVIDARGNQASKDVRFSEWKQIEDGLAAIRRSMTERYQLEF